MTEIDFDEYAQLLKALAHPTRLRIIDCLRREPVCVKNMSELMNTELQQANLSQHLSVLRSQGIVSTCREGNRICYSIRDERVVHLLDCLNHPVIQKNVVADT